MIFHSHSFPHYFHPKKSAINTLIFSSFFRIAGVSMLVLFSSVYIYTRAREMGMDYSWSIYTIVLFYSVLFLSKLIFLFLGQKYSLKKGFKHTIWLSIVPFTVFIPLIILSEQYFWLLPISAFFWGAHGGFFWWGYHGYFVKSQKTGHYGKTIGITMFVHTIAGVAAPLIGALLIESLGFRSVFITAYILEIVSLLALGRADDISQKHDVNIKDIFSIFSKNKSLLFTLASRGMSMETYSTFWQLYLFLIFGTVIDLGFIVSVSLLFASFVMIFLGKYIDKHGEKKTIFLASPFLSIAWIFRFFITSIFSIIAVNVMGAFSGHSLGVSVEEYTYKMADNGYTSHVLLMREIGLILGVFAALVSVSILTYFGFGIKWLFIIVSFVVLLPTFLVNNYASKK